MKRKFCLILALIVLFTFFTGCKSNKKPSQDIAGTKGYPIEVTDSMGRKVTIPKQPERIVSGYYISTYMLINLGLKDKLAGIESKANTRPVYKQFAPNLLEVADVGTAKAVNLETITSLNPDLVVLPFQQVETASKFEALGIPTVVVRPETMDDFLYVQDMLGKATGYSDRLTDLVDWYKKTWAELESKTKDIEQKSVYLCSSSDPLNALTPKMFQADIIKAAGGKLVTDDIEGSYWTKISLEQLYSYKPEFMFISSGSKIMPQTLLADQNWQKLFPLQKVYNFPSKVDGWDNPALSSVLGAYFIASKLHPGVVTNEDVLSKAKEFYQLAFNADISAEHLGF